MIYNFLTDQDLRSLIKDEFKSGITTVATGQGAASDIIKEMEAAALQQIKNKLRRYNMTLALALPLPWNLATAYVTGGRCSLVDKFYIALKNGTNKTPATEPTYWKESDPRDVYLVMITIDITLYHIHARFSPRALTEIRVKRYEDALKWLDDVMLGHENPDLPLIEDSEALPLEYGFDKNTQDHYY